MLFKFHPAAEVGQGVVRLPPKTATSGLCINTSGCYTYVTQADTTSTCCKFGRYKSVASSASYPQDGTVSSGPICEFTLDSDTLLLHFILNNSGTIGADIIDTNGVICDMYIRVQWFVFVRRLSHGSFALRDHPPTCICP